LTSPIASKHLAFPLTKVSASAGRNCYPEEVKHDFGGRHELPWQPARVFYFSFMAGRRRTCN